jgi:hypothetical protein
VAKYLSALPADRHAALSAVRKATNDNPPGNRTEFDEGRAQSQLHVLPSLVVIYRRVGDLPSGELSATVLSRSAEPNERAPLVT